MFELTIPKIVYNFQKKVNNSILFKFSFSNFFLKSKEGKGFNVDHCTRIRENQN